jgi:5-methyltetrahydropteroyltriglutamate--homocysteine methyltransferase
MSVKTLITGFPRIGKKRELKKALESYWSGTITSKQLHETAFNLKKEHWLLQKQQGIDLISVNDFSLYDNMLDTAVMLNAIPERFTGISDETERYFAMARGNGSNRALEMTKWFNTNYHYIVPELHDNMQFKLNASKIISEYNEAKETGITPKINIIGPVTFLALSKTADDKNCYSYFDKIIIVYKELLNNIAGLDNTVYVQFEEPLFAKDATEEEQNLLKKTYDFLSAVSPKIKIIVTTYFEHSAEAVNILGQTGIWAIGLDFVYGKKNMESLSSINDKKLIAGVVDGRNVWINDINKSLELLGQISSIVPKSDVIISTSCSLLHVPYRLEYENASDINKWLSFAFEKVKETSLLSKLFYGDNLSSEDKNFLEENSKAVKEMQVSEKIHNPLVSERVNNIKSFEREGTFDERIRLQKENLKLHALPTTTIGSFPQTEEIRQSRKKYRANEISEKEYEEAIKKYIDGCIAFQEEAGIDVLVHGEPERNDMVEYFGEALDGFHFTKNGWVQSYGSRCVKPPIIFGDVSRTKPITVATISYAQSKTKKIMKGMLTGPVTILNWSFVRNDKERYEISRQIALALKDEILDLQNAGIKIIQVDEAAFKEGYPLRTENVEEYEKWAVQNFKLAVSGAKKETQIHTHMCYSEFNEIIDALEKMDADVLTIETARSGNELMGIFKKNGYKNEIGPGVYDIHSPRVPSVEEFINQIKILIGSIPIEKLWINPDCGLKTRKWEEVKPALKNMVEAAKIVRAG